MSKNIINKKNQYKYIFFDLDGTITESDEGITKSAKFALENVGIFENLNNLRSFIGPSLRFSFGRYINDEEVITEIIKVFRARYETIGWKENKLYSGIYELIRDLKKAGYKIVLASSKPEIFCKKILDLFNLMPLFDFVGGATLDDKRSDKADVIKYSLNNLGNPEKSEVIMIGDRSYDIVGAHNIGLDAIGVSYGYAIEGELEEAEADYIADNIADLRKILL